MDEIMEDKLYDAGGVKRADLRLRVKYYGLRTKIFLIGQCHYAIQILNYTEMYEEIREDFCRNIAALGDWVDLVKDEPAEKLAEVLPLVNIAEKNEGIFLTHGMFESLLASRFPNVNIISTEVAHQNGVILTIALGGQASDKDMEEMRQFIVDMRSGYTEIRFEKSDSAGAGIYNADVGLACTDKNYSFSVEDSEFWFGNVEGIYGGKVAAGDLRFYEPDQTKCYLDFSLEGARNVNLRGAALLYDKIYISFPLGASYNDFLDRQHLSRRDVEEMAERGKLAFLLPNTEGRYDKNAIERLCQANRNCVVSKRGINALMAISYCELERKYMDFWKGNESALEAACMECIKSKERAGQTMLQWLLWPIRAKMESYELLMSYSPMKLPSIGANVLLDGLFDGMEQKEDIRFELTVNSNAIHIASALKATYFPFQMGSGSQAAAQNCYSDWKVADALGAILNAYQHCPKNERDYINQCTELLQRERNGMYLLDTNNEVGMKHILDYSQRYNTPHTLKNILMKLASMDEESRKRQIAEYNNLVAEIGKEKFDPARAAFDYLLTGAGFAPGVGTVASLLSLFLQILDSLRLKERMAAKRIEKNKSSVEEDVSLLDKISRIARIAPRDLGRLGHGYMDR